MNFLIMTLGCKVNQYESQVMGELLQKAGYQKTDNSRSADICIINSCTVTTTGDAKCRKLIHRVRRENPQSVIVLCGCMPQAFSDEISLFDGCDIVLGNTSRREIVPVLDEYFKNPGQLIRIAPHEKKESFEALNITGFEERTRAYIKIEDGCNRFCSYCIIPYARGRVRSKSLSDLRAEALTLAENGFKEIVLVGINLSAYGAEFDADVYDAVKTVCEIDGIKRVRLGSIEPERMTRDMLEKLAKEKKFCPHFHLSLQAGCDATLKRMRRHYDTAEYRKIVGDIRELYDNPSVTTDVMVGFVGETNDDFNSSLEFCDNIGFAKVHVFPYSRRKGTSADKMDGHVSENLKHQRAEIMIAHTLEKQKEFLRSQLNKTSSVLIESRTKDGYHEGYTDNYTKVRIKDDRLICGEIYEVLLVEADEDCCVGVVR